MEYKHQPYDLAQMQSLPLEAKIRMTQDRIRIWYESWKRYEIYNKKTKRTRFVTACEEPELKDFEYIDSIHRGHVYVSFSGGKDSTVLKHIVDSMYDDVPALFVNTGLEFPEIQKFVRDIKEGKYECFNNDVEIVRPEMRFDEVIKTYGYPVVSKEISQLVEEAKIGIARGDGSYAYRLKKLNGELLKPDGTKSQFNCDKWKFMLDAPYDISDKCCKVMKKKPAKAYEKQTGRKSIIGTMASESRLRYQRWLKYGCNSFDEKRATSNPLSFWTEQDILLYIKKYNVPYCSVYGDIVVKDNNEDVLEGQTNLVDYLGDYSGQDTLTTTGCARTGCIFCMFGCHLEKEPNRFQRLKETHPKQYEYCIGGGEMVDGKWQPSKEGLGLAKVLDYINVPY